MDFEVQGIFKEIRMKKRMEQDATNSTISALEVQLQQLIKAFTDYSNVAAK